MRHGWGRDVWRPPWSKVGLTSKHFHMKASPSHSQGRSSRGAIGPPPSDPRRPPSQGFLELQANDGNADNTGWETPEGKCRACGAMTVTGKGVVKAQDTGAMNPLKCTRALRCEKCQTLMAWEVPGQGPYPPGKILSVYREEVQEVFVE